MLRISVKNTGLFFALPVTAQTPAVSCHIFLTGLRIWAELWEFCCAAQAPAFGKGLDDIPVGGLLFAKAAKKIAAANKSIGAMAAGGRNMSDKSLMGRIGNISENVIIGEEVKYRVFSRSKQAEAAGILLMPQRQYRAVGCKAMDTLTIKSIYYDFSQTPFPIGLVGKDIDGIDLLLFDSELAEDFTHLVDNPIYLTQEKIKKHIRKTQYIIDKLKEVDFREYFEKKEFFLLNCLDKFDKAFLKRFIRQELQQTDSLDNLHGINLENIHQHLTNPRLTNYYNDFDKKTENCWTVLDEDPNELKRGYQVVYSELRKQFGLAIKTSNTKPDIGTLVGWYGSFVSTLNGM